MKPSTAVFHLAIVAPSAFLVSVRGADDHAGHGAHAHHVDLPLCSEFNVTGKQTCRAWCGNDTAEFDLLDYHADTADSMHVDVYTGFECECIHEEEEDEPGTDEAVARAEGEGHVAEEKHCHYEHELQTCSSVDILECGDNATTACQDYCVSIGAGKEQVPGRMLLHESICSLVDTHHNEVEGDGHVYGGDDEEITICFCDSNKVGKGVVGCADEGWDHHDNDHEKESDSATVTAVIGLVTAMAVAAAAAALC